MILSNLRAHTAFLTILLVFCYFVGLSATADTNGLPESVVELLSCKTTDFTGVANQIPEHQLPTALAAAKLLKFRALHGETSLSSNEAEAFETILLDRMSAARQVAFSQNEVCRKKVEQHEIMFDGQKLLVPAHFVADTNLAVISYQPNGEAGNLFPDFNIEVFSQSPLTEMTLAINGQAVNTRNILINQGENAFELSYRTPATPDSFLSIGTHTAEITINNQSGETIKQQWSFTVGIYDIPTPPLPADVKIISEIALPGDKLLPGQKLSGSLRAVIYEDTAGNRYIEYQLTTPSGQTIKSRNLAFIGRKMLSDRNNSDELTLSPQTDYAFIGNTLNFAYFWSGVGEVLSENWQITSGSLSTSETSIKMAGGTLAKCTVVVESTYPGSDGNQIPYQYEVTATKTIYAITLFTTIFSNRMLLISNDTACAFELSGDVGCSVKGNLVEGAQYPFGDNNGAPTASLKVNRLRWKIHAGEGSPTIENPVATSTKLVFGKHGFAEIVFDVKLTWQHAGEIYESNFEPTSSGLYAFYPVTGKAEFTSFPLGQLSVGRRRLSLKSFEFEIKGQKRLITSPDDFELAEPLVVSSSSIWPASSPVIVTKAIPVLHNGPTGALLEQLSPFTFLTPMMPDAGLMPLSLSGVFYAGEHDNRPSRAFISNLPSIPVYSDQDVLQLQLNPAEPVVMFEGVETEFSAQVAPVPGMGQGLLSEDDKSLDILNGYKVSSVEYIHWFEEPLGDEGDWPNPPVKKGADFTHIFEPWLGPGSYTMNCGIVMNLQESDTGEEVPIHLESSVPVDVLPGLRIFSPINDLAYPLNASLKVKTSFDKDPETWKTIAWYLNGKLYKHGLSEAPFFLELNRTGKWSLVASLTIEDPQGGEPISLQDRVDFIVNPVDITLTPARKVLDFSSQQSQELSLNITLNGKKIEKPGQTVVWQDDGFEAVVDPIEWFSATAPNGCASVNHDENSLTANVNFANAGAATALATVTVRLIGAEKVFKRKHKNFEDEFEEPIFTFPVVRADLWAIDQPKWGNLDWKFPTRAIKDTKRSFRLKDNKFTLNNKSYSWSPDSNIDPDVSLRSALLGVSPVVALKIETEWAGPDDQMSLDYSFAPKFTSDETAEITLNASIDLGNDGKLQFPVYKTKVSVKPVSEIIELKVVAEPFAIKINQLAKISMFFGPAGSAINLQDEISVWNGEYRISLSKVNWQVSALNDSSENMSQTTPNINFSTHLPGDYFINAGAVFKIECSDEEAMPSEQTLYSKWLKVPVSASLKNWSVLDGSKNYLKGLAKAVAKLDQSPPTAYYQRFYENGNLWIWQVTDGNIKTKPLAVACDSTVSLTAKFEPGRLAETTVYYEWFDRNGVSLNLYGKAVHNDFVTIPTPPLIGRCQLKLEADGSSEIALFPEVYIVQKITDTNFDKIYYLECVQKSVDAFTGYSPITPAKDLVDHFYDWWWSEKNEYTQYGVGTSNGVAAWVPLLGGGMCENLGNFFFKCLECHGIEGLLRVGLLLSDNQTSIPKAIRSPNPVTPEYWGAAIYTDPGLQQEEPTDKWPKPKSDYVYGRASSNRYKGNDVIPANATDTTVIDRLLHVEPSLNENYYMFLAPIDGHAVVYFRDPQTSNHYLYDPSFGSGKFRSIEVEPPDAGYFCVKPLGGGGNTIIWDSYLSKSISYMRGFTFFKDNIFPRAIGVFDIPINKINFMEIRYRYYGNYGNEGEDY